MAVVALAGPAFAQDGPATADTTGAQDQGVHAGEPGDIIVTATRRAERLQDVPVAVSAISGEDIAKSGFREVSDIQYLAPNITFSATNPVSNGGGYQIRGIGTQTYDSGVEQSVGLVVDGVVIGMSRDPGATGFADIERVEVLRGPQGTLFGKNSAAGVIQIITNKPRIGESSLDLDLSYGERNDRVARATANVPLTGRAALRVTGYTNGQDGAIPDIVNGTKVGDRDNKGIRGKLLWEATDALSLLLTAEYQTGFARDAQILESLGSSALYNSQFARFATKPGHDTYIAYNDGDWTANTKLWGTSLQANYQLGQSTLTSITAYRSLKTLQLADIDAAPIDIFNNSDGGVDSNQFTQELRLTSPAGKRLEYTLGLYYYHTHNGGWAAQYGNYYGLFGVPIVIASGRRDQINRERSLAVYGQATFALTDALKLIGGLRYTNDRNTGSMTITRLPFPAVPLTIGIPYDGTVKADNVSGKAGLQYQPTRDLMIYATYSTGYKGPAIDGTGGVIHRVKPETVKSYEVGAKATLFGGRMTLNGDLYWEEFTNFQTTALDSSGASPTFLLTNAGLMRARGVELEANVRMTSGLRLSANGAYSDSTYRDFTGPCYAGQPVSGTVGVGCYILPGTTTQVANYHGYRLPNAPKWSYTVRASYSQPISNALTLDADANWAWRGGTQAVLGDPNAEIDAYGLLNGDIGLAARSGAWRIGVYARNLLNQHFSAPYSGGTINPGGYFRIVSPDAFRTIGGTVSFHF
ncbi:MAG TPA: TonB-dependent receptor [Sphingomonas sp.]|nr:TonB-dependent receptor [Sphingomonas sp.]